MKSHWVRLPLAFAVFIGATVGTGYIVGRVTSALLSQAGPLASKPSSSTAFSDEELLAIAGMHDAKSVDALTDEEVLRADALTQAPTERDLMRAALRAKLPNSGKPKKSWAFLTSPVAPYPFLIGIALGGVFGIVAGRELLRAP